MASEDPASIPAALSAAMLSSLSSLPEQLADVLSKPSSLFALGSSALALYVMWEQVRFKLSRRAKGKSLPGPAWATPLVGSIVEMVRNPYQYWEDQRQYSFPGLSWNSIVGVFTVFVTDAAMARHVFSHNSKDTLLMALHPSAKAILGPGNLAFMHGPEHKALRKSFLALFTRRALSVYVRKQDAIVREHLRQWLELGGPMEIRDLVRQMNAWTSQEVFAGPYLGTQEDRLYFGEQYKAMTEGFLALPINFPGTKVWAAQRGRKYIVKVLTQAAAESKRRMAAGAEPECLLDFWSLQVLAETREAEEAGVAPPKHAEDGNMGEVVMDFLFASQDASSASVVWTVTLMAEYPDVLAKVRAEQEALRGDLGATIDGEMLGQMPYTRQVVKEILRHRPPATMVPQMAMRPFRISDEYTAPKGTLIVPSIWSACLQGFEQAEAFDPDRFSPERQEDIKFARNYMVFGHGPHYCVGKEYAMNHLMAFLSILATTTDFTRTRTPQSDGILYLPTIYPQDAIFTFTPRPTRSLSPSASTTAL